VDNFIITQRYNKTENWTKAMKYMLCDLKWALHWFIANYGFQPPGTVAMASGSSSLNSIANSERNKQNARSSRSQHDASAKS
jgi:beclin 1